jgi:5'-methylthioadenosine phosphorylase
MKIGIIGSTGFDIESLVENCEILNVIANHVDVKYKYGKLHGHEIYFFKRNLYSKPVQPKLVNYKAIVGSMKLLGIDILLATAIVGSLNETIQPGSYVVLDQFLDYTISRDKTFFDENNFEFIDFTNPYCINKRKLFIEACKEHAVDYRDRGCYVCVDGPRYETAAEIKAYRILGGDVIGMTSATEAILAREAGICYSSLAFVSNFGAGIQSIKVKHGDIYNTNIKSSKVTASIFNSLIANVGNEWKCDCCEK